MRYAYYPGCSALRSAVELDAASRLVFQKLGLEWFTLDDAACCGSRECGGLAVEDESLRRALNARTLAMAERQRVKTMITVCSTCQLALMTDNKRFQQDPALLAQANRALAKIGMEYRGSVEVKHLLYVIIDDIGLNRIANLVTRPLLGLRIAPFYGCHLLRPGNLHGNRDDPYHPRSLGDLIRILGGEEVVYSGATKCCGFHSLMVREKTALRMSGKHLQEAINKEATLMVTPCPLCHTVLDSYQPRAAQKLGVPLNLPILHLPQLIGLALGLTPEVLMLKRHVVPLEGLFKRS